MEKKIVDYLHLYGIDCPIMTPDGEGSVLVIYPKVVEVSLNIIKYQQVMKGRKGGGEMHYKYNYEDCQLLLSKLEDITKDDVKTLTELIDIKNFKNYRWTKNVYGVSIIEVTYFNSGRHQEEVFFLWINRFTPDQTHYLLKKGYWLFGSDWFDEGLIIDRKTLKP